MMEDEDTHCVPGIYAKAYEDAPMEAQSTADQTNNIEMQTSICKQRLSLEKILKHIEEAMNYTAKNITTYRSHPDGKLFPGKIEEETINYQLLKDEHGATTDTNDIKDELLSKNFTPTRVTQLKQIRTKKPLPIYLVELNRTPDNEKNFHLTNLLNLKIKIENFQKRTGYTQCWNCHHFHHSSANCGGQTRCLKCGKDHRTSECQIKNRMINPVCINCGKEGHVASWRGCEKFPKPRPPPTPRC
ncbi:unnamed protein product [Larinioides sclopetarius]|uniref:Pre-C2HC domain-containing protein n=1 Tax=Larinioides sclopetarius TaxID=280406 RepID=A0AAV2B6G3_9ARAC